MQKKGHNAVIEQKEISEITDSDATYSFWSNPIWVSGFGIYVIGSLLTAAALNFGAQSVLAPLGALTLVCNAILATKFLGEPFERNKIFGIALVVLGSVLSVIFGPESSDDPITIDNIKSRWTNLIFLLFFAVWSGLTLFDFALVKVFERKNANNTDDHEIVHGANFLMISYTSIAAYFGSINVLLMKSIVTILGSFEVDYFADWFFYVTIASIVAVNFLLEFFRQRALFYFDAVFVVPIYQVMLILGSALMGAVFFDEFATLTSVELALFTLSIGITLFGVAILAYDVGAVYNSVLRKLHLSREKKKDESNAATKALDSFVRSHGAGATRQVFPVWGGGVGHFGAEYYRSQKVKQLMFSPATVRDLGLVFVDNGDEEEDAVEDDENEKGRTNNVEAAETETLKDIEMADGVGTEENGAFAE